MSGIFPVQPITPGPLGLVARALQARLQLVFPVTRFQHDLVPAKVTAETWKALLKRTPFIGLGWNAVNEGGTLNEFDGRSHWSVYIVLKHATVEGQFFGDAQNAGIFQLAAAAVGVLHGFTIPRLGSVLVTQAASIASEHWEKDAAAVLIDLSINTSLAVPDVVTAPGDLGEFERVMATWNAAGEDVERDEFNVGDRSDG